MRTGTRSALLALLMIWALTASVQARETTVRVGAIEGTLLVPDGVERPPVAVLIAGSGPTDRDGNGPTDQARDAEEARSSSLHCAASPAFATTSAVRASLDAAFGNPEDFRFCALRRRCRRVCRASARRRTVCKAGPDRTQRRRACRHASPRSACRSTAIVLLSGHEPPPGDLIKEQLKPKVTAG